MKKIYFFLMALTLTGISHAVWDTVGIYDSSFTATNEGPSVIPNTPPGTILVGVMVGTTTANGTLKIYNSSNTTNNQVASITLNTVMGYNYNVKLSSGLTYTTVNNTGGVTIIFKRMK